jgi:integral membrane sensor domain MASE1
MRRPSQRPPLQRPEGASRQFFWDLLTFERLITGTLVHLVYWAGLGIIAVMAFGVIGASIGVAVREGGWGYLLAFGVLAVGLLGVFVAVLLWRAFCEFYVTIFKISEDLSVLREDAERERSAK